MDYIDIVDIDNKPIKNDAVRVSYDKSHHRNYNIYWNKVKKRWLNPADMNKMLDEVEKNCKFKEVRIDSKTISSLIKIKGYYFKRRNESDKKIEICGCRKTIDGFWQLFRFGNAMTVESEDMTGLDAFKEFHRLAGKEFKICGLPGEFHKFRGCAPKPIDWIDFRWKGKIIDNCQKSDISSAYGFQLSNELLPDPSQFKVVAGKVAPDKEWPFAYYLDSNNMAIWNEGSTFDWAKNRFAEAGRRGCRYDVEDSRTLLMKGKDYKLQKVIKTLYEGRKEHPENKQIMNLFVGYLDRSEYFPGQLVGWPIRAAIIFRCNQRILDLCNKIEGGYGIPVLINTDSITWMTGEIDPSEEKGLGKFAKEYAGCRVVVQGPKCYQIDADGKTITRYSGPHRKDYISTLAFGDILKEDCLAAIRAMERKAMYRWSPEVRRFINKDGGMFTIED